MIHDGSIAQRWQRVKAGVADAALAAGRNPQDITIIAVAKKQPAAAIVEAVAAGVTDIGENYVQELVAKRSELAELPVRWHFIGHLQSNKAKLIAGQVDLIHALDSASLAAEVGKRAPTAQQVLLAVNLGGELTKSGVSAENALSLARGVTAHQSLSLRGLMTMPPPDLDPAQTSAIFRQLRELRDQLQVELKLELPVLSMGMSDDYPLAIAQGATHVRIGTAIFGPRS